MNQKPYPDDDAVGQDLQRVRQQLTRRVRRNRWRHPLVVAGSALLLCAAGAGIAAVVVERVTADTVRNSVRCFEDDSLSSRFMDFGTSPATATSDGTTARQPVADPVELCAVAWRSGLLGRPSAPTDPAGADFPVPALAPCRLTSGQLAAFPRDGKNTAKSLCKQLGIESAA